MTKSKLMSENNEKDWPLWEVFYQPKNGKPYEHAGSLHASDAENALQNARDVYARFLDSECQNGVVMVRFWKKILL